MRGVVQQEATLSQSGGRVTEVQKLPKLLHINYT